MAAWIVDFGRLFAALDEAALCLPRADQTDQAEVIGVGLRLQAVRIEALQLYHICNAGRTVRRAPRRARA